MKVRSKNVTKYFRHQINVTWFAKLKFDIPIIKFNAKTIFQTDLSRAKLIDIHTSATGKGVVIIEKR